MNTSFKMYVLTRLDLDEVYRCVQGAHAVVAFGKEHGVTYRHWNNGTFAFLGVRNLVEMNAWKEALAAQGKEFSYFREPDQMDAITAIACYDTGEVFARLPPA